MLAAQQSARRHGQRAAAGGDQHAPRALGVGLRSIGIGDIERADGCKETSGHAADRDAYDERNRDADGVA